ncbi:hypothetical protein GFV12_03180 [Desulfurobacterium thermolithotrophum]|uniref:hypothetical protein n=1 Tax=Desulfurobacterium thermolithotrophum TaxID=64160 RepID=UPI0013D85524|nr:hypothetical protein [Desulfurobacterium thermolithotrophum]
MDLTQTILELKENTSKLVERMATQSDKWDKQVNDLVNYGKSKIDGFIAGARKEYPALNLYKNPLFKGEKGKDFSFGGWNPQKHKYTYEAVPWDYNDITKQMAQKIGSITKDDKGNLVVRCCSIIGEAGLRFLKVHMEKTPNTDGYFLMSGVNPRPPIHWGQYTAIITVFGVGQGRVRVSPAGELGSGDVVVNGLVTHQTLNGWHHVDTFTIHLLEDVVEFYIGLPVLTPGYVEDAFKVLIADIYA